MKTIFIFFLLNGLCFKGEAGISNKEPRAGYMIHLKIHRREPAATGTDQRLKFVFSELFSMVNITLNNVDTTLNQTTGPQFISVNIPAKEVTMQIQYAINGKERPLFKGIFRNYLVNAGDTLDIGWMKDSVIFKGNTAHKMNIQTQLFKLAIPDNPKISIYDPDYFTVRDKKYQSTLESQLSLIEKEKKLLDKDFYDYLINQCIGLRSYLSLKLITGAAIVDKAFGARAAMYYKTKPALSIPPHGDHQEKASFFVDFLYLRERINFELSTTLKGTNKKGAKIILDRISNNYKGGLRDKLLIVAALGLTKSYLDANDYFSSGDNIIPKNSYYYPYYDYIKKNFSGNAIAYDFALQDTTRKMVKLSDFKGKVVILDFWFTGCRPCMSLKKQMTEVHKTLSKRDDLVFMTVSIDKTRETWINSIKTGDYTHPGSVNLIAPGGKDPLIKYYNIHSFPQLMLIDKNGRLAAMKLPFPSNPWSQGELLKIIEDTFE